MVPTLPVALRLSLAPLVAARADPTIRLREGGVARASHTPEGPGTLIATRGEDDAFTVRAFGPGAGWLLAHAPGLRGAEDRLEGFDPGRHAVVARAHHRRPGLRMIRTGTVTDVLATTIIAQKVTGLEAARSWTRLVRTLGSPAPKPPTPAHRPPAPAHRPPAPATGSAADHPPDLWLPPTPAELARTPVAAFRSLGIDRDRARNLAEACRHVHHLDAALDLPPVPRLAALTAVPGIGVWTAAHLARVAGGDADAVEVGDYHVKNVVSHHLAGEPRGTDERMLELLAPFAGHRGRVVRLLGIDGGPAPRYGPRRSVVTWGGR